MLKLKVPVVGELVQKMAISRFSRTFATLIASGVPMMRSLEIVGETSGNRVIAHAIESARNAIREGQKISAPLAQSNLFPGMVTHMIDIGEETGRLSEMLAKVSDFYDSGGRERRQGAHFAHRAVPDRHDGRHCRVHRSIDHGADIQVGQQ